MSGPSEGGRYDTRLFALLCLCGPQGVRPIGPLAARQVVERETRQPMLFSDSQFIARLYACTRFANPQHITRPDGRPVCRVRESYGRPVSAVEQRAFQRTPTPTAQQEASRRRVAPVVTLFFVRELAAHRQIQPPLRSRAGIEHDDGRPDPRLPSHVATTVASEGDRACYESSEGNCARSARRRGQRQAHHREPHDGRRQAPPSLRVRTPPFQSTRTMTVPVRHYSSTVPVVPKLLWQRRSH